MHQVFTPQYDRYDTDYLQYAFSYTKVMHIHLSQLDVYSHYNACSDEKSLQNIISFVYLCLLFADLIPTL